MFLEDQANLELFSSTATQEDVRNYYISQLYLFNQSYSVTLWVTTTFLRKNTILMLASNPVSLAYLQYIFICLFYFI